MQDAVYKVLNVISVKNPKVVAIPGPGESQILLDYRHQRKSLKEIDEWLAQLDLKLDQNQKEQRKPTYGTIKEQKFFTEKISDFFDRLF